MATAGVARGLVISPLEDLGYLGSRKMDLGNLRSQDMEYGHSKALETEPAGKWDWSIPG